MNEAICRPPTLDDKYDLQDGSVFLTGIQALVRLPLEQARRDLSAGLHPGTLISGYPGSPLGGYDHALLGAARRLNAVNVHYRPGVNEELAASVVWGAHLTEIFGGSTAYQPITSIWFGKNPGLGRSIDVLKHANYSCIPRGGAAIALAGDDPGPKSSTIPNASEQELIACAMPVLYPGAVSDFLSLGLHAIALSRFTGLWVGMKLVTNLCDGGASFDIRTAMPQIVLPDSDSPGRLVSYTIGSRNGLQMERQLFERRLPTAAEYIRANQLNSIEQRTSHDTLGIAAAGNIYVELRQALQDLGFDSRKLAESGIRLLNVKALFPTDAPTIREFAKDLRKIIVIEEKRPVLEPVVKDVLYNLVEHPTVLGVADRDDRVLFSGIGELDATGIARRLGPLLLGQGMDAMIRQRLESLNTLQHRTYPSMILRTATYCSGCPHSRSTVAVAGETVGGGIGCHGMAARASQESRRVVYLPPMGHEGATWIGASQFSTADHFVQNVGDGTFFHSGSSAVRACIAAGVNITFKLLWNSAVAMTGGQSVTGGRDVLSAARLLHAEGVARIHIVTENYSELRRRKRPANTQIFVREKYEEALTALLSLPGTTVLIFDQECAAERRRARKRGTQPTSTKFVVIEEGVCEGCGDCGAKSNCMSVEPIDTEFGRKTQIHQSSCNQDYSCLVGDCPSFLTVYSKKGPRRPTVARDASPTAVDKLPTPATRFISDDPYRILLVGIGGTGVVTANHLLAFSAIAAGLHVRTLDQTGSAQKGGSVVSSLVLTADYSAEIVSNKITAGKADLAFALDPVGAIAAANAGRLAGGKTVLVGDLGIKPTAEAVRDIDVFMPHGSDFRSALDAYTDQSRNVWLNATAIVEREFDNHMLTSTFMLGVASQAGLLPMAPHFIEDAITLNNVDVMANVAAFRLGRQTIIARGPGPSVDCVDSIDADRPNRLMPQDQTHGTQYLTDHLSLAARIERLPDTIRRVVSIRVGELIDYQNARYAERYLDLVLRTWAVESDATPDRVSLTSAVAHYFFKLMAYKDEYEVARLLLKSPIKKDLKTKFDTPRIKYNLHPPTLRGHGLDRKIEVGRWIDPILVMLRATRRVRGTRLDVFGRTEVRRTEHALIGWYEALVDQVLIEIDEHCYDAAVAILESPDKIRGYEGLKLHNVEQAKRDVANMLARIEADRSARRTHGLSSDHEIELR